MASQTLPNAVTIGSQTAGADGDISRLQLPGGIFTTYTGISIFYPHGRPTQRIGIKIDIESIGQSKAPAKEGMKFLRRR